MPKKPKKISKKKAWDQAKWSGVENALAEGTFSGYAMGVIETEKIFAQTLKEKKIPGLSIEAKIKHILIYLSLPENLEKAREVYCRLVEQLNPKINEQETKEAIAGYWQALKDIEESLPHLSFNQKLILQAKHFYQSFFEFSRNYIPGVIFFLILVIFIYDTNIGSGLATRVGQGAHILVFSVLPWALGTVVAFFITRYIWQIIGKSKRKM